MALPCLTRRYLFDQTMAGSSAVLELNDGAYLIFSIGLVHNRKDRKDS